MKKQTGRNKEGDLKWETQKSTNALGLCQAVLTLGLLLSSVGFVVSESSPGATRCLSFRSSDFGYHDQVSRGCTVQEQKLSSTSAQWCHVWPTSIAVCDLYGLLEEQPAKHRTDFSVAEKVLRQADTCLKECSYWSSNRSTIIYLSVHMWIMA